MKQRLIFKTALSAAILTTLASCATAPKPEWEADKTYKLTVLHTNDHHGRFWQNKYGEYGMAARKTLIDELRADIESEEAAFFFSLAVILIQVFLNLTFKMLNPILKV